MPLSREPTDLIKKQPEFNQVDVKDLSMDDRFIYKLRESVTANLKNDQFSVEDLAEEVAYSRSHLHRKLQSLTGQSISQFIRSIRLEHALEMLQKEIGTVSEIAYKVGFGSSTYFIKCFHEHYGFSPGEARKRTAEIVRDPADAGPQENTGKSKTLTATPLETLHPASSEHLILEIFEEMARHKPSLEKFLIVDTEEGEAVDIRLLAYQIIKNYPWPIGVELRRLFSGSMRDQNEGRYNQLQKAITRTLKLVSFIMICELCDVLHRQAIKIASKEKQCILAILDSVNTKDLIQGIKCIHSIFRSQKLTFFVQEFNAAMDDRFFRELEDWLEMDASYKDNNETDLSGLCTSHEQTLISLLKKCAFLVAYKLVNVGSILVKKARFKEATFEHRFHMLNSSDSEFKIHQEVLDRFADSHSVLLMRGMKEADQFLNLSPLVIDTHIEEHNATQKSNMKRDIYLFEGFERNKLKYSGTGVLITDDLSSLDNYQELIEGYNELIEIIRR